MGSTRKSDASQLQAERLRAMLAHAEEMTELEKQQLARTLHNEFGSALTALAMRLAVLARQSSDAPGVAEQWTKANAVLAALTGTARRIQSDLRPGALDVAGLKLALEEYLEDFSARHAVDASLALPDEALTLDQPRVVALFRIFQELLTNVRLHARARQVRAALTLDEAAGTVALSVADDGVGFDAAAYDMASSHGLRRIAERAAFLGGDMQIESAAGQGAKVLVTLPLANNALHNPPP